MSRNSNHTRDKNACIGRLQKGFMIPLALFIIIALSALALALTKMNSQASTSVVIEGVSLQAFFSAETGAQYAMHQLLFNVTNRSAADTNCTNMPATISGFPHVSAIGLQNCSVSISCSRASVSGNPTSFYTIQSTGICGSGVLTAERTIEVNAYM